MQGDRVRVDDDALLRFVERLALALADTGFPRMAARVFVYVLATNTERYTAAELANALRVSPAAISGAVRTLVTMRLLIKEREPGARVDTYRVEDGNLWAAIVQRRAAVAEPVETLAAEGAELLGDDTPAGRRLRETQMFYAFFRTRIPQIVAEWHKQREESSTPAVAGPE